MPLGDLRDRHSARGIIAELGDRAQVLAASDPEDGTSVLGCVVGVVLDKDLIDSYCLSEFGAHSGDGLLAYIGILPEVQGGRATRLQDDIFEVRRGPSADPSLANLLFERWLELPEISVCPNLFVRTRRSIEPVLYLLNKHGFSYRGEFQLSFRGMSQTRMVFGRGYDGSQLLQGRIDGTDD